MNWYYVEAGQQAGPVEEAAQEACALAEELRARPAADGDQERIRLDLLALPVREGDGQFDAFGGLCLDG
mgnify:CR=1 FL=1